MPFERIVPRPFMTQAVSAYAPATSGIYGLSNSREWIYIGEADDIQAALFKHLLERETLLMKRHPTGFVFETCDRARRSARQDRLVLEYEPTCNRHSYGDGH